MRISLIVAMDENGLIGAAGGLPWRLPADLRHFKQTTLGKPILMGRRTHESIGRPLPERDNIVLSRDPDYRAEGCRTVTSFAEARGAAREAGAPELMVIGGAQVYAMALPKAGRIYLTRVHDAFDGDTHFPDIDFEEWEQIERHRYAANERNPYPYSFITLRRRD
ncbi:Dihydrofolate reductase [Salinisphaera sp. PC39]|uniref:dihydrofolate reductase n=1 Tax=Salinisphaera sp. PC39 TaxID=1304156 RepID=UPI003341F4C9